MKTTCPVQQLSRGNGPAVHRYYDVAVESPDGRHLLYFEFASDTIPGPGVVIVANVDGSEPRIVGESSEAIGHVGGSQHWIDNETIGYCPMISPAYTRIVNILTGETEEVDGLVRSFNVQRQQGIIMKRDNDFSADQYKGMQQLYVWDRKNGTTREFLHVRQCAELHPLSGQFDAELTNFQNPKWSTDDQKLMVVFGNEVFYKFNKDVPRTGPEIKSLYVMNGDGSDLRFVGLFTFSAQKFIPPPIPFGLLFLSM